MKRMVLLCAAVLACGGLAGCGQHKDNSSSKISSLKAENSSLKAKKSSSHKVKHHQQSSSSSQNKNDNNIGSNAQAAKDNNSTGGHATKSSNNQQQASNQTSVNSHTGDWHHDPNLWNAANNADYSGTIFQNATPQERYDYLWDQADHSPAPSNYSGQ